MDKGKKGSWSLYSGTLALWSDLLCYKPLWRLGHGLADCMVHWYILVYTTDLLFLSAGIPSFLVLSIKCPENRQILVILSTRRLPHVAWTKVQDIPWAMVPFGLSVPLWGFSF